LSFILEKYLQLDLKFTQLDKKYEDLSRENLNLNTRIEALDKENRGIKDQLQSERKQINSQLQSESEQINSQLQSESTQINGQLQSESKQINSQLQRESNQIKSGHRDDYTDNETNTITGENDHFYEVEENEHEKEEYYESHPDLETMADVMKINYDFKEATSNEVNEIPKHGIYKEKRLLIDSGNIF